MRIVMINSQDRGGGAAWIAFRLSELLGRRGHDVELWVGRKRTNENWVREIPVAGETTRLAGVVRSLLRILDRASPEDPATERHHTRRALQLLQIRSRVRQWRGLEDYALPGAGAWHKMLGTGTGILHLHNLHGLVGRSHFALPRIATIGAAVPVVWTLHDMWAYTGHCVYSFACERWKTGCGRCPNLGSYSPVSRDRTARNLKGKSELYGARPVHIVAPCRWMLDQAKSSILRDTMASASLLPYGVDLDLFSPAPDRGAIRSGLGIRPDETALVFISDLGRRTPFRDFGFVEKLALAYGQTPNPRRLVVFEAGGNVGGESTSYGRYVGTGPLSRAGIRDLLRAGDVFMYPAITDNFPNVVLEALASGIPVVSTLVGGIPEQVRDGVDGFLHAPGDLAAALRALDAVLAPGAAETLGRAGRRRAEAEFGEARMVDAYEALYLSVRNRAI